MSDEYEMEWKIKERPVVVIRNMVVDPQGRIYKRPKSRLKLAWMALRGWKIYAD